MTHPKKVWHLTEEHGWQVRAMEAIDANHAVSVDPEHWSFEKPIPESERGPTVEEWVKAGYKAENYPPPGYESKSTPEEIASAIEAQKVQS